MPTMVDFNGVNISGGGAIQAPEGKQVGSLSSWEMVTSNNGNPMVRARFAVPLDDGREASQLEHFVLIPKSLWKLKQFVVAAGIDLSTLEGEIDVEQLMPELEGHEVVLNISRGMDMTGIERFNVDKIESTNVLNGEASLETRRW